MDKCVRGFAAIKAARTGGEALRDLVPDFAVFHEAMRAHLHEEEEAGIALMRHHFTHKEFQPVEKQIVKHATPAEVGWLLRPMGSDAARLAWMSSVARIPAPVQALVLMPAARRYHRDVVVPMTALRAGATEVPPQPDAGCACAVM
jgi:hypothetical protein